MARPLSAGEHIFWLIDRALSQNFVMVAHLSGGIPKEPEPVFRRVLDLVQKKHPALRRKFKDGKAPEFISDGVGQIPLRIIERKDGDHWMEESEKEIQRPFPWTKGPLARLTLLISQDKCDLLAVFCHVTMDGVSGFTFVENVLSAVAKLSRGETADFGPPLPELPSVVDFLREDVKQKARSKAAKTAKKKDIQEPVELAGDVNVPVDKRITHTIQRELSQSETGKLVTRCKEENTSVHGAICAAVLQATVEQIREARDVKKNKPLMIGCLTPVSIRHLFTEPVGEGIGNFISNALHYQLVSHKTSLWTVARKVKNKILKILENGEDIMGHLNAGNFLKDDSTPGEMLASQSKFFPPVAVTNIGRLEIPEQFGNITLESIHFTAGCSPAAKNGFAVTVTTFAGRIIMNFLYAEPYISKQRATKMVENVIKRLKAAAA
jgi:NRPS condensation-like uncharacterized protein